MIIKISLPKNVWESIIKYGNYEKHPNGIEVILQAKLIPRFKEFSNDIKKGITKVLKNCYGSALYSKPCIMSDEFIAEIYELLEKEDLFLEINEIEELFSFSLMIFLVEDYERFYGNSCPDNANAS